MERCMLGFFDFRRISAAALILVIGSVIACGSTETVAPGDTTPEPTTSFYIKARVEIVDDASDDRPSPFPPDGPAVYDLQWWSEGLDLYRQDVTLTEPPFLSTRSLVIGTADRWVSYDANLNYYQSRLRSSPGAGPAYPLSSALIGPVPLGSIEDWTARTQQSNPDFQMTLVGVTEILGREVDVYEFGSMDTQSNFDGTNKGSAVSRIWFDKQSGLLLKYESAEEPGRQQITAEVTSLEVNPELDAATFVFNPPEGSVELQSQSSTGLLNQPFVISDLVPVGGSKWESVGGLERSENLWSGPNDRALRIRQKVRSTGLPEFYKSGERVDSSTSTHGGPYYLTRSGDPDMLTLAWQNRNITVVMDSFGLDRNELVHIAALMTWPDLVGIPEN